jgi:hypothetical protein
MKIKDAAAEEANMLGYMYENLSAFVNKAVAIYLDEKQTRENIMAYFKLLNFVCPFQLINDYRLAKASNAL